jgi:hypothetical protein
VVIIDAVTVGPVASFEIINRFEPLTCMLRLIFGLLLITSSCITTQVRAETLSIESGPRRAHLLELFTSEGCSSCPPAEAWMSSLKDNPGLWRDFVPVAFHVDYWDRLGWRDPFANKAWTARQYQYSERWNSESVYTPGFVLDGREMQNRIVPSAGAETTGTLKMSVVDGEKVSASFQSANGETKRLELHVARLGFDLSVRVKAGENGGRKLLHDFVVLSLENAEMVSGKAELRVPRASINQDANSRSALVAWVTEAGQTEPIQAAGGWLL